jgi:two-component system nitrate/nitrite response regulator NarL
MGRGAGPAHPWLMPRLAHTALPGIDARPLRLLLVDDSPKVLAVLRCMLAEPPGLLVIGTAVSAEQGLETARVIEPDVVLLDVRMPGMGGLAAVPLFKQQQHPPPLVVLLTLNEDIGLRREAERAGADALLAKTEVDGERVRRLLWTLSRRPTS